jgi:hypothetical protein
MSEMEIPEDEVEKVTLHGALVHKTKRALLICINGQEYWFPLSKISRILQIKDGGIEIDVEAWLARQRGLE